MYDYVLVGGGLQNALVVQAVRYRAPGASVALVEACPRFGIGHTWCFHPGDVPEEASPWVEPLIAHRWEGYQVRFPGWRRDLRQPYAAITGSRLDAVVRGTLEASSSCRLLVGARASQVLADRVVLEDGTELPGRAVIDGRGLDGLPAPEASGFQKFLGLEVELENTHALDRPVVMDAEVEQRDGYRFLYLLPLGPRRLLAEDTTFSDGPTLDTAASRASVHAYLAGHGWKVARVVREECGVLPMPRRVTEGWAPTPPWIGGMRGGWFHPATGYSLPAAVRFAAAVTGRAPEPPDLQVLIRERRALDRQASFGRRLNRLLFGWVQPDRRWRVFRRFYRLPEGCITRFYAMQTTFVDRMRILFDRPPLLPWLRLPGGAGPVGDTGREA